jgi:hypothetical protein
MSQEITVGENGGAGPEIGYFDPFGGTRYLVFRQELKGRVLRQEILDFS